MIFKIKSKFLYKNEFEIVILSDSFRIRNVLLKCFFSGYVQTGYK
jgi:hypothetical protein